METKLLFNLLNALPWWFWVVLAIIFVVNIFQGRLKHLPKIIISYRRLNTLQSIEHPAQQFAYLRKIDPFVFEEMILSAFKALGFKIIRNRRYTGDGGVDGKIEVGNELILIQAKRYATHINPAHVKDFTRLCEVKNCHGLFIHTGKTGSKSRQNASRRVDIVSGQRMLDLLNTREFTFKK